MNSDEFELLAGEPTPGTDDLMDDFVHASSRSGNSPRELYLMRETLNSLVRLARSEQLLEIRRSVERLLPGSARSVSRRRRSPRDPAPGQAHFVFGRDT